MQDPAFQYLAVAGDAVDEIFHYGFTFGAGDLYVGIYTVVAGKPANLVGIEHRMIMPAGPIHWHSIPVAIPLTAGTTYTLAWRGFNFPRGRQDITILNNASKDGSTPLPAVWLHVVNDRGTMSLYANVANTPPVSDIIYPCRAQLIT